jgi:hypothetical protein
VGFVVDKVALGQVFPCQFHSTSAPLLVKMKKKNIIFHLHHMVAQESLRLRCVRSICCGILKKLLRTVTLKMFLNFFTPVLPDVLYLVA